ncbi:hypothetical protein BUE93_07780 [Chromobacterium amazonense]|uniref:Uncharacterized protein n=1 Tax=Chromobacterium amazonense TaxID=1382803 RepID=A0A2S9X6B8_9NEIS|nr:hypothetical protein [Chromobacterium amazonense]PRP71260.1 hypothetical protein BUE93_07780 [Chromobacterium amazonense]
MQTNFYNLSEIRYFVSQPHNGLEDVEKVWKLGEGPCGKCVVQLEVTVTGNFMAIRQFHRGGTKKVVVIPLSQITSAIHFEEVK